MKKPCKDTSVSVAWSSIMTMGRPGSRYSHEKRLERKEKREEKERRREEKKGERREEREERVISGYPSLYCPAS